MRIAVLLTLALLSAIAVTLIWHSPHSYAAQDRVAIAAPASGTFLAGTDELGRDRAVRVSAAMLLGLAGACVASALASTLALLLGGSAAFCPRWAGASLLYAGDLFLTLPWIFLLMLVRAALPLSLPAMQSGALTFLLLAILGTPAFLRMHFNRASGMKAAEWLLHAHASGLKDIQIGRFLLPHLRPLFWAQFLLYVPICITAEANLGTLGLGITEPLPSWGNMLKGLQSAALLNTSRWNYLPLLLLVGVLTLLELSTLGVEREI